MEAQRRARHQQLEAFSSEDEATRKRAAGISPPEQQINTYLSREDAEAHFKRILTSYRETATAVQTYRPDTTYQGQLVLFLAADSLGKEADWLVADWQAVCEQPIEVHLVPGNHISFLKAPNVAQVAKLLRASRTD